MDPISTALAAAAVKEVAGPVAKFIKHWGIDAYSTLATKFEGCFQGHVDATRTRCEKMKNILYKDQSVEFLSQYVNIRFCTSRENIIEDSQVMSDIIGGTRFLICGTAGAGKTMFMRWSALQLIDRMKSHGRVPLFLEMRYFEEEYAKEPLEKYIYDKTSSSADAANYDQFLKGLRSGLFIILLDAIDEISPHFRERVVSRVMDFLRAYPLAGVAISSRFDEKLESIQEFKVLRTRPMDRDQIISVLNKLEYDEDVKAKLIIKLQEGLYEELSEFLSNPLLATIMLLTFDHSADIPNKLTAFYQQAFEVLYHRHDAAKGAYKRAHYAGLPIDRFQSVFSAFSFQTYLNYKLEFSDTDLVAAFREACDYCKEETDPELIIKDSMESVCVIQREGLDNVFSHRSFQEYFCALFISKYREADVGDLIEAVAAMENRSSVLRMLYELAPEMFEYEWVLPILSEFLTKYGRVRFETKTGFTKIFSASFGSIIVDLKTNEVHLISLSTPPWSPTVSKGDIGRWLSVLQFATHGKVSLFRKFFNTPVWDDFENLMARLPDDVRPAPERVVEMKDRAHDSDGEEVTITAKDASWAIHTNLPQMFINLRSAVRDYHDEIVERRNNRRATVKSLLAKPRARPRRVRKA